jgi:peptide/nickel transport system substrate-binding protein
MNRRRQKTGAGRGKLAFLAVLSLAAGVLVGRWLPAGNHTGGQSWKVCDELHQMVPAPEGFNVVESNKVSEVELLALLHDRLYHYDPVQNQLVPGLARSHEVSPDGKTWTFHLRPARTPEGTVLTGADVVFSVDLCLDHRFNSKRRGNLMVGGKPVLPTAPGPLTVTFTLPEPYPSFLWAASEVLIVPREVYQPISTSAPAFRRAVGVGRPDPKFLAGFGPYRVVNLDTQEIRLERNPHFWGRGDDKTPKPYLERLVLSPRKTGTTLEMDFLGNALFCYRTVGPGEAERLARDSRFQVLDRGPSGWCLFWWLNQNPKAPWAREAPGRLALFRNEAFRRALARVIDRSEIVRRVFRDRADVLLGPVSPVFRWAVAGEALPDLLPAADHDAALAELRALGVVPGEASEDGVRWLTYREGSKRLPLEIELRTSQSEEDLRKKAAEVLAEQFRRIGLRIKVVEESFRDIVKRLDETFDYEAALMFRDGSPNAATARSLFVSAGDMHFFHPYQKAPATEWEAKVDRAFERFAASSDPRTQQTALDELQRTWVRSQPVFYLLNDRKLVAIRRDFEVNGLALTGRAADPILTRTVVENVRLRTLGE